jgi:radical SAM protein with 4Fe4S-binding SPASM domain
VRCHTARTGAEPYHRDTPTLSKPSLRSGSASKQTRATGSGVATDVPGFRLRPQQVTWETTPASEGKAAAGRSVARLAPDKEEFSTAEAFHLIREVAAMRVPLLALTGGDPLLRPDLFPIVEFAARHSVRASLTLLPTASLSAEAIAGLKACGLMRAGLWLHASTAALHDAHNGVSGSYRRTLEVIGWCHEADLPVQINTLVQRRNVHDVVSMIELLAHLDVALWSVFFLVPSSRTQSDDLVSPKQHEEVFARLYAASKCVEFQIRTSEGQHYQRYLVQQRVRESKGHLAEADLVTRGPKGVNDGSGFVFIDHHGEVHPSRYLPLSAGNVKAQPLAEIYRDSALFVSLRDRSRLKGKCGRCRFRNVCGGSRARAYAMSGDLFAEDPCCVYEPSPINR